MENAVQALKMGAAIMVFTIALATTFMIFSQAREVSDAVFLATDKDTYMEYIEGNRIDEMETSFKRTVGLETIIPTLYKYYDEKYNVNIIKQNGETIRNFEIGKEVVDSRENVRKIIDKFVNDELLKKYKNTKFEESFVEEIYHGNSYTDDFTGETIEAMGTETIITITYQII